MGQGSKLSTIKHSAVQPIAHSMGTGRFFRRGKSGEGMKLTTYLHLRPIRMSGFTVPHPPHAFTTCTETASVFF
jgi:hypothetical protein